MARGGRSLTHVSIFYPLLFIGEGLGLGLHHTMQLSSLRRARHGRTRDKIYTKMNTSGRFDVPSRSPGTHGAFGHGGSLVRDSALFGTALCNSTSFIAGNAFTQTRVDATISGISHRKSGMRAGLYGR